MEKRPERTIGQRPKRTSRQRLETTSRQRPERNHLTETRENQGAGEPVRCAYSAMRNYTLNF